MQNTKIVHQITRKYMMMNKKRTLTTLFGIVFMVLLLTCVFAGKETAFDYMSKAGSLKMGSWNVAVYDVTADQYEKLKKLDAVEDAGVSVHIGLTEFPQSQYENRPLLNVRGMEEKCFEWTNVKLLSGHLPENENEIVISESVFADYYAADYSFEDQEDLLGQTIDAKFFTRTLKSKLLEGGTFFPLQSVELKAGETEEVDDNFPYYENNDSFDVINSFTGNEHSYTIVGVMKSNGTDENSFAGCIGYTLIEPEKYLAEEDRIFNVFLMLDAKKLDANTYAKIGDITENYEVNDYVMIFSEESEDSTLNAVVKGFMAFFIVLIMLSSVVLIYNVFNLSYRERCKYLGMLSSVGATAKQKRSSVYYEAFSLLLIALPTGFVLGLVVIYVGMHLLAPYMIKAIFLGLVSEGMKVTLKVTVSSVIFIVLFSIITVLISAFLPAMRISRVGAIESIRGNEQKNKKYKMRKGSGKILGAEGMLARNFLQRQKRKRRGISLAIVVFLVILFVTAYGSKSIHSVMDYKLSSGSVLEWNQTENSVQVNYWSGLDENGNLAEGCYDVSQYEDLKDEIARRTDVGNCYEIISDIFSGMGEDTFYNDEYRNAVKQIMLVEGVLQERDENGELLYSDINQAYNSYFCEEGRKSAAFTIAIVPDEILEKIAANCGADYETLQDENVCNVMLLDYRVISTQNMKFTNGSSDFKVYEVPHSSALAVGDSFTYYNVMQKASSFEMRIAGILNPEDIKPYFSANGESSEVLILGQNAAQIMARELGFDSIYDLGDNNLYITPRGDGKALKNDLQNTMNGIGNMVYIEENYQQMAADFSTAIKKLIDIMLICFVALTSIICLLNLISSIQGRILDQKQEFAILKSVGMTGRQIEKMLVLEAFGMLGESLLIAILVSGLLCYVIHCGMNYLVGYIHIAVPGVLFGISMIYTIFVVVGLTVLFFRRMKNENLLENIRCESV